MPSTPTFEARKTTDGTGWFVLRTLPAERLATGAQVDEEQTLMAFPSGQFHGTESEARELADKLNAVIPPISFNEAELDVLTEALRLFGQQRYADLKRVSGVSAKNMFHAQIRAGEALVARLNYLRDGDATEPGYDDGA